MDALNKQRHALEQAHSLDAVGKKKNYPLGREIMETLLPTKISPLVTPSGIPKMRGMCRLGSRKRRNLWFVWTRGNHGRAIVPCAGRRPSSAAITFFDRGLTPLEPPNPSLYHFEVFFFPKRVSS